MADELPGQLLSQTVTGGRTETEPTTITGVIKWDVQPQVQGGNDALTNALTQTLSQYDATLGPSIVESLKYPDTAPVGLAALTANTTPQQKTEILNSLAPFSTSPEHYAYRDPSVEFDVSLLNRQAMADVAKRQQNVQAAAMMLMQQGELATADTMKYLADHGAKTTSDALTMNDQMRESLKHLEQSSVHTQVVGNNMVAVVTAPNAPLPMMNAVGPIDPQGVWHPTINGYAISTPARQQLMETLARPDVKQHLQGQGITSIAPVYKSSAEPNLATRPPTQQQTRQQTPPWEVIAQSPAFQQLTPAQQLAAKKNYFDHQTALSPPVKQAVRENPAVYQPLQQELVMGPQPRPPSLSERLRQGATGLLGTGKLTAPLREMASDIGTAGELGIAGFRGAMRGFLASGAEQKLSELEGRHPIVEELAQMGTDIALGAAVGAPIAGPVVMQGVRGAGMAAEQGMPMLTNAKDLVLQSLPLSPMQPTSTAAAGTRALLGMALLNKAAQYAAPAAKAVARTGVGKAVGKGISTVAGGLYKGAAAVGSVSLKGVSKITPEVIRRALGNLLRKGSWSGNELPLYERIAAANNMSVNRLFAEKTLEGLPEITIIEPSGGMMGYSGKLRIWDRKGVEIDIRKFEKQFAEEMKKVQSNPKYIPIYGDQPIFTNISRMEGRIGEVNAFFMTNGQQHLEVAGARAAKGANMIQIGNEVHVLVNGSPTQIFKEATVDEAWQKATAFVDELPMAPTSVEDTAYKKLLTQGVNPYYMLSRFPDGSKIMKQFEGALPDLQSWGNLTRRFNTWFAIPAENFKRIEQYYGIPLYSQAWLPLDMAMREHKVFVAPFKAELEELLGKPQAWRSLIAGKDTKVAKQEMMKGYTYLMETEPGTQAWDDVIKQYGLNDETGKGIRAWFEELLPKFGVDPKEFFLSMMPQIQKEGLNFYKPKVNLPKSVSFFLHELASGEMPLNMRELDIRTLMEMVMEKGSWNKHVKVAWENAYKLSEKNAVQMTPNVRVAIDSHLRAIKGWGTWLDKELMDNFGTAMQKLFLKEGEIPARELEKLGRQLYAEWYGLNAGMYFAFRPASVTRQLFQTFQTIYPRFGNATFHGIKEYLADPHAKQVLQEAGVLSDFAVEEGIVAKGTQAVRAVDEAQRGFAAYAEQYLWDKHISAYIAKTMDWPTFAKLTKLQTLQPVEQTMIKKWIADGQTLDAKHLAMRSMSTMVNFDYAFQNRPIWMTGNFFGRALGQFGVFPVNYQEYLVQGLTRGDIGERIAWLTRWTGANVAMQETFKHLLGADASNWLWMYPSWFGGSPQIEVLADIPKSFLSPDRDAPSLKDAVLGVVTAPVPGLTAAKDIGKTTWYAAHGDLKGAVRQLGTGFPPTKEEKKKYGPAKKF